MFNIIVQIFSSFVWMFNFGATVAPVIPLASKPIRDSLEKLKNDKLKKEYLMSNPLMKAIVVLYVVCPIIHDLFLETCGLGTLAGINALGF